MRGRRCAIGKPFTCPGTPFDQGCARPVVSQKIDGEQRTGKTAPDDGDVRWGGLQIT